MMVEAAEEKQGEGREEEVRQEREEVGRREG